MSTARYTTVSEISERKDIKGGERTIESCHLHFNGPGASGFGVKRTAMLLPESVMLLAAPSCCGRHATVTGSKTGFDDRMYYLQITERDLVTGKYLKRIPEAAEIIAEQKPEAIFLSMTCVDAVMGTDIDRIARAIEERTSIRTVGSFMDPIARESRKSPMASVRRAIMSCLEKRPHDEKAVNIIGDFVPLDKGSDLYDCFRIKGYEKIRQISACHTFKEYSRMSETSLNVVIDPHAVEAAKDMEKKLGIPFVHIRNVYGPDRIRTELGKLGYENEEKKMYAEKRLETFCQKYNDKGFAIGEAVNGNSLELALTLLEYGADVRYVLKNIITPYDMEQIKNICLIRPDLKVYSGVHPSVNGAELEPADVSIGLDAGYLSSESSSVCWNMEKPYLGYSNLLALLDETEERIRNPIPHRKQIHGSYLTV